jgi:hypothetical protein
MRVIDQNTIQPLRWTQPRAARRAYELRAGEDLVATLRWRTGALAEGEEAAGRWLFRRTGFWHPRVLVSGVGSDAVVAVFSARWTGTGTLEFGTGRRLHWSAAHAWQADDGTPLVQISHRQTLTRLEGMVGLTPAAGVPDLGLLVLVGWYLLAMQAQDTLTMTAALVPVVG